MDRRIPVCGFVVDDLESAVTDPLHGINAAADTQPASLVSVEEPVDVELLDNFAERSHPLWATPMDIDVPLNARFLKSVQMIDDSRQRAPIRKFVAHGCENPQTARAVGFDERQSEILGPDS